MRRKEVIVVLEHFQTMDSNLQQAFWGVYSSTKKAKASVRKIIRDRIVNNGISTQERRKIATEHYKKRFHYESSVIDEEVI